MSETRLRRVCAWCNLVMDDGTPGAETTHGMCDDCKEDMEQDARAYRQETLRWNQTQNPIPPQSA